MSELHSYRFAVQRVVAAVIAHDPDPPRPPLRRAGVTALAGLIVAAVALALAGAYGLVTGHSRTSPTDPGAILLDRVSGARYVYLPADGRLHPVLNYTSGLLLAQAERPAVKTVRPERLAAVPLGEPLGIPGAPDSLPAASELLTGPWSVCTSGGRTTLLVGEVPKGGPAGALLVRDGSGRTHLIAEGRRFLIPSGQARTLGWYEPWPVPSAWLEAIPPGPVKVKPGLPAAIPQLSAAPASACVTLAGDEDRAIVRADAPFPSGSPIAVARGHGAVVTTGGDDVHLVTDAGVRFELASPDLLGRLGYAGVSPLRVPERLLAYLPAGPALDPVRAGRA
ncbi:type VII secretion protein EccB [Actinoplanes sp. NPDC023714]|uniref:type VII secretion protein EccB n=1 Tax=Actinoplanes sp. NPDC023714 TaxID=3154322 RepID=UPI0033FDB1E8